MCRAIVLAVTLVAAWPQSFALTDIATKPIAGSVTVDVKPNIMLLMDTSLSMGFTHMPDDIDQQGLTLPVGYKSSQCNTLYYNPNAIYILPKGADGTNLPTPSFTSARYNYYSTDTSTVDLSSAFQAYDNVTRARPETGAKDQTQAAYYYVYSGTETLTSTTLPCTQIDLGTAGQSSEVNTDGGGKWKRVIVSSTSGITSRPDERQNFANWYVYYRTRMAMAKSSLGLAFAPITSRYRVGFVTANPGAPVAADKYLAISDFTPDNKLAWYNKVNAQVASGSSPMREGLARVGRHYANKHDSINDGMDGDPVQYACQKNFTLMTTDGYWNVGSETKGPVQLDGSTLVGQQDGSFTGDSGYTPYGVWDGGNTSTRVTNNKFNTYTTAACDGGYRTRTTSQASKIDTQTLKSTAQVLQTTQQNLYSTSQVRQSTAQTLMATSITSKQTAQTLATVTQVTQSTQQNLESTSQWFVSTTTLTRTQTQRNKATLQNLESTQQMQMSTSQTFQAKQITKKTTLQMQQTVTQALASTKQILVSTSQQTASTLQWQKATSRMDQTLTQKRQSTSQLNKYDGSTEVSTPSATCTAGGNISCYTVTTGPTLVADCTAAVASSANFYTATTCASTVTGPTPVASCTTADPVAANNFQRTTCTPVTTPLTPVATCTASSPSSANSYTTTSCSSFPTGPTLVASCTAIAPSSGNNYVATICNTPITTGPTPAGACATASATSANNFTTTTCPTPITTPATGVATCTNTAASAGNSWTSTTCTSGDVPITAVSSCTGQTGNSTNGYKTILCTPNNSGPTAVAACTTQSPTSANSYVTIQCPVTITSASAAVASCTPVLAANGPGFEATTCSTTTTGTFYGKAAVYVPFATGCTTSNGSTSPFMTVVCSPTTTTSVPVATCTANAGTTSPYLIRTCPTPISTPPTPVATCTNAAAAAGNSWVKTTCTDVAVGVPTVMACTPGTTTDAAGLTTICTPVTTTPTPVLAGSCTLGSVTVGGVTTNCTNTVTTKVPVLSCTANPGTTAPYLTRTCPPPNVSGPTPVAACTPVTAANGAAFTAITCTGPTLISAAAPVSSCTGGFSAATGYITTCTANNTGPTPIDPTLCTVSGPTLANGYTNTTCPLTTTPATGVSSCSASAANSSNGWKLTTCTPNNTLPTLVATCTASGPNSGNSWVTTTCAPTTLVVPTPIASCTPGTTASPNFVTTTCSTNNTTLVPVASCTASGKLSTNDYTSTTCTPNNTGPVAVSASSCTASIAPSVGNNYTTTTCLTTPTTSYVASCTPATANAGNAYTDTTCPPPATTLDTLVPAASCVAAAAGPGNSYTSTQCDVAPGSKFQVATTSEQFTEYLSGATTITTTPTTSSTTAAADVDGICYTPGVAPVLPAFPTAQPTTPSGCTAWKCAVETPNVTGGSKNSLADVSQYYYVHDLRPEMADQPEIASSAALDDRAPWQHMTTFALGLGVSGTLQYQSDYAKPAGDFARIRPPVTVPPVAPTLNWPAWPDPTIDYTVGKPYDNPRSIDDFWHAAVNGRGQYFSANDPTSVVNALTKAFSKIDGKQGSGSAANSSTTTPIAGNQLGFVTSFVTVEWSGDVKSGKIDLLTGKIDVTSPSTTDTPTWSAQTKLDAMTFAACDNRTIYIRKVGGTNNLTNFSWDTKACAAGVPAGVPTGSADTGLDSTQQAYFDATAVAKLSQYAAMTDGSGGTEKQRQNAAGANLVNFIRGQRGLEVPDDTFTPNAVTLYRGRTHVLGDVVGSAATYVAAPSHAYTDAGYDTFKTAHASRASMVYVGANDGMLHAIYAPVSSTDPNIAKAGVEAWAYVPQAVMPELYRLADTDYKVNHHFFVDGTPTTGDVYDPVASAWKTILVGGLNAGGKGYYAMDVTDPANPKSLWEFNQSGTCYSASVASTDGSDCNLGLTFGRPIITKLVDGTWVVMVTSGYNNVQTPSGSGDGRGYLYVLNAVTGKIISKLDTGVGDDNNPSGLREINNYVANGALDNTTLRVYGGDLLGNIWRFDVNDNVAPIGKEATLVATAKDPSGTPQPITTHLQLAEVDGKTMIVAATGQLLGASDTSVKQVQSVYGFLDLLGSALVYPDLRGSLRQVSLTKATTTRTTTCSGGTANCALTAGYVLDLPESGERVNVDPFIVGGTLTFVSNVPSNSACEAGGHSWINFVGLLSGVAVASSADNVASKYLNDSLSVGVSFFVLPDGTVVATSVGSDSSLQQVVVPQEPPQPLGRRVSWREIKR
jgi:Tfp pilus tip-associated adhesin PilY1